ncbi:MAG TPA: glycoside hydrolase family 27 protein [Candidatus Limiplasma sp.]|nr:glycoside hydrolase family 27 protein [Candidatus Limiplasma sp.]HRX07658.1 glycoside hydrolase family 27 protein [Candidatus Limiplasma sp.]
MIAATPPMGWNSWDCYGAAVDEKTVRQNADYMATHLKPYGWDHIVVDIQWYQPTAVNHQYKPFADLAMDGYGRLLPAENRFPSAAGGKGFKPLADYVHSLGLRFGIHIMRGLPRAAAHKHLSVMGIQASCADAADPHSICAWNPDMYGVRADTPQGRAYYESIFALYASWGVDFVKVDDIARELPRCLQELALISEACRACGREMILGLSPGPAQPEYAESLKQYSNMWRITDDFWDDWALLKAMFPRAATWCNHAGPGHWPDADMLPLGAIRQCDSRANRTRFTRDEQITMMTLWCMMRSPLMMGGELTLCDEFTMSLLTKRDVLDILSASHFARPLYTMEDQAAWVALRKDGTGLYLALFNLSDETKGMTQGMAALECGPVRAVTELWSGEQIAAAAAISASLPPHGAKLYFLQQ